MALLDSTCFKVFNGILFVIFRVTDQKLWFFKVSAQIWFNFYIEFLFDLEKATWRYGIRRYQFGWIAIQKCWILSDLDARDLLIPVHLSELF
jgi:hypothetical protein